MYLKKWSLSTGILSPNNQNLIIKEKHGASMPAGIPRIIYYRCSISHTHKSIIHF